MKDSDRRRKVRMDGETAKAFAGEEFEKRHPRETWPEWLRPCTVISYSKDQQQRFVVSFAVSIKEPLRADEHWEEKDGKRQLVKIDPVSPERFVVYMTPKDIHVYFRATIDPGTAEVTVSIDKDLSSFVGEELNRD